VFIWNTKSLTENSKYFTNKRTPKEIYQSIIIPALNTMAIYATITILSLLALSTQVLACVHSVGSITVDPLGANGGISASLTDNNVKVCDDPWYIDQDGHYAATCIPGTVFALSKNGDTAWYGYGSASFSWQQNADKSSEDCYGACEDRKGACIKCTQYAWDIKEYC
jgi:hypothetical protein